jgi:hypothetical protein
VCCGGVPRSSAARPGASSRYKAPNGETLKMILRAIRHIDRVLVCCCLTCRGRPHLRHKIEVAIFRRGLARLPKRKLANLRRCTSA